MSQLQDPLAPTTFNTPPPTDQRRQPRILFQQQAWAVDLQNPEVRHSILTQNLSVLGIGFLTIHAFPMDAWLVIFITFDTGVNRKVLCHIKRNQPTGNGFYLVGAEFESALPNDSESEDIPAEWLDMVQQAEQSNLPLPKDKPILEQDLIPGTFSAPTVQVIYDDIPEQTENHTSPPSAPGN